MSRVSGSGQVPTEDQPSNMEEELGDGGVCPMNNDTEDDECGVKTGLATLQVAVDLMNNNQYNKAIRLLKPKADVNMYHSMAYGSVLFLQAMFGMEREVIDKTVEILNKTVELCNRQRRPRGMMESLSSWVFGQRLDNYTASELQAEIFYAEANLILSFLIFLQDESLMSFVKGGLRIRSCHSLYKQLYQWVTTCEQEGTEIEENFAAGVKMGYGCFNLFLSLLPSRILKLLEFIGFSGNRRVGLEVLRAGAASETFRAPLCTSFLLFYYTVAAVITGIQIDADCASLLLAPQLSKYPNSVQFLYFKGRVLAMRGNPNEAMEAFNSAMNAQDEWRQIRHLCWWELAWCHCLKSEWSEAAMYSNLLHKESRWSRATFLYMKASFTLMDRALPPHLQKKDGGSVDGGEVEDLADVMRNIAPLKQRIAGKSIPIEKFAVSKSERYLAGDTLPLSGMELMYFHNAFLLIRDNLPLLENLLQQVTAQLTAFDQMEDPSSCGLADRCVVTFLEGALLRVIGRHDEAEKSFLNVIEIGDGLVQDFYTVPASYAELGLLYIKTGRMDLAEKMFETARSNYKGYHMESRIHFRIHEGYNKINIIKQEKQ